MEGFEKVIIPRFKYAYSLKDVFLGVKNVLRDGNVTVPLFQTLFPEAQIHLTESAASGIKYALEGFGFKKNARIGVQPYTCSSVLGAIVAAGFTPFFIDINQNLSLNIEALKSKVTDIDALIVTHTFGFPADIAEIKAIASHLPVIEDCAHALFSQYEHRFVGTFFDAAVFSFGNGKFPSLGGGGMLVINDPDLNERIKERLSTLPKPTLWQELTQIVKSYAKAVMYAPLPQWIMNKILSEPYLNNRNKTIISRGNQEFNIFKSIEWSLPAKLEEAPKNAVVQRENGAYLAQMLRGNYEFLTPYQSKVNYFAFVLIEEERDRLSRYLKERGIMSGKHFQHALAWAMAYGYAPGSCPVFEKQVNHVLTIPCNYGLNKRDLDRITHCLLEFRKLNPQ
ncbi:DegT/DnrJ/EryC1/StrS family aminotransferase [Runella salmonicolor]|uniref:DegT/DnrJ/EryC1/StrS family aminotransferase n=1 Tax=Runella salmonicolor TaxID=2950278 RepID=UPI00209D357F|nr:DegT/DnrJ/EryC1/StrS family aminotransferase [Runella salmonicolor]